jgi:hypothetical protein
MRYVNLMGGQKPHLLVKTVNNLGAETRVHYAPSTKFYLQDKRDGKPWITRLPFPVHVVERVETYDHISRNRFVTRYAYHHGYFDGEEREFRGFGMVEQWDTEEFAALSASDGSSPRATTSTPPPTCPRCIPKPGFTPGSTWIASTSRGSSRTSITASRVCRTRSSGRCCSPIPPARRPDAGRRARGLPRPEGHDAAPGGLRR